MLTATSLSTAGEPRVDNASQGDRNLDVLRAIAVLVVLVAHCCPASGPQEADGHYGGLSFFVHTARVLLLSLRRQGGPLDLAWRGDIQRVFRIYPLRILCVLATLALRISWPYAVFTPRSGLSITANLLLVQNFLHERLSISPPLWSLPFELQMYAVLPAIFWLLRRRGMGAAVCLAALSVELAFVELRMNPFRGLWITRYVPCFMGGAFAYCAYNSRRRFSWWLWPVVIGSLGMVYGMSKQTAPSDWITCMVLGLLAPAFREAPPNLMSKAGAVVARYSYGIYLSHAPLLWLCFQRLAAVPVVVRWAAFAALICVIPAGLYHLIEEPFIRAGKALSLRMFSKA